MQNLSNASTTLIQLLGKNNYFILVALFLLISSCKSSLNIPSVSSSHKIVKEYNTKYSNEKYQFSYAFPSDYAALYDWKSIKNIPLELKKRFSKKSFLIGFQTNNSPYLTHYIFVYPITKKNQEQPKSKIDSLNYSLEKVYKHSSQNVYIHFYAYAESQNNFHNLINEYEKIFESVKIGEEYSIPEPENSFDLANEAFLQQKDSTGNYILPLLQLEKYSRNYTTESEKSSFIQSLATYHSFINHSEKLPLYWKKWRRLSYLRKIEDGNPPSFLLHDNEAIDFLLEKCSQNQVVMFNEAHFDPQHRLLITHLLENLYQKGFRFLALEALWEDEKIINDRGFIIQSSGFYTKETAMADLIRQAHHLGFYIVVYDDFSEEREKKQAQNLFEKTIAKDKDAKVIVLAGFGHISEEKSSQKNMMAAEFEALTGINPLTIDQVEYMNMTKNNWLSIVDTTVSKGFIDVDIKIANSFYNFPQQTKKVEFNFSDSLKKELNFEKTEYKGSLKVYNLIEWEITKQAIPFQIIALKNIDSVNLFLKQNQSYHLEVSDPQGEIIFEENLEVE